MKNVDWGWQGKARKLRLRGEFLYKNMPIPADITFRLPTKDGRHESIAAHKLILAIGSEVLYAMFFKFGPNVTAGITAVDIPNYTADVFEVMVAYLYSDRTPGLTMDNAMEVLKCAEQYGIPELVSKCRDYILEAFQIDDGAIANQVFPTLELAGELGDMEIVEASSRYAAKNAAKLLDCESFLDLSHEMLEEFLKRSDLKLKADEEIILYRAVHRWAQSRQAEELWQGLPCRSLRDILGATFNHIRFPVMSPDHINEGPLKDNIFSADEIVTMYELECFGQTAAKISFPTIVRPLDVHPKCCHFRLPEDLASASIPRIHPFDMIIEPFPHGVAITTSRFRELCESKYLFRITFGRKLMVSANRGDDFPVEIPDVEKKLFVHDSAGTVSLRWKNAVGYYLDISIGKHMEALTDAPYGGIVFGRVRNYSAVLKRLKLFEAIWPSNMRLRSSFVHTGPEDLVMVVE